MFDMIKRPGPAAVADTPHIWLANGIPVRAVHDGRRWRVVDEPTRLGTLGADFPPLLTHPPEQWSGWRFTARAEDGTGETLIFDVADAGGGQWRLLHVWR
jgi:hypothetical protein